MKFTTLIIATLFSGALTAGSSYDPSFLMDQKANQIEIRKKTYKDTHDYYFVDGLGRETTFRGWNMSNTAKKPIYGFKSVPMEYAEEYFNDFKKKTGSNMIRWVMNWEATTPEVDTIDYKFLADMVAQYKMAIKHGIYIMVDFHQDIFSRHIPTKDGLPQTTHDGWDQEGAPKWVIDGMNLPEGKCGFPCITWSINYFTNSATKAAHRMFWNNDWIETENGNRRVQDEFFWTAEKVLTYIKENLTPEEFDYIIGLDPWNEPAEGGLRAYEPALTPRQWHTQKLWPFHMRARKLMDKVGYADKPVFAEPSTFWNIGLFIIKPRGGLYLENPPTSGFVFNAHFYDEKKELLPYFPRVRNGAYLKEIEQFRTNGRHLNGPSFISEYGAWGDKRGKDQNRIIKGIYQAMEMADLKDKKSRRPNFYSSIISGTQWVWDGFMDDETKKPNPDFKNYMDHSELVIGRVYPRKAQGEIMHFYYNDMVRSTYKNRELNWMGVDVDGETYFSKNKFSFMAWRGNKSKAPTEFYLPKHFDLSKTLVITDDNILYGDEITQNIGQVFYMPDTGLKGDQGKRLFIFQEGKGYHFALVVQVEKENLPKDLEKFRKQVMDQVQSEKSPLKMLGKIKIEKLRKVRPDKVPRFLEGK